MKTPVASDEEILMKELQKGSDEAFDQLFCKYHGLLFKHATQYVDVEDSKDIVADTFVKVWLKKEKFTSLSGLKVFMYKSVTNAALQFIRNKKRREGHQHELSRQMLSDQMNDLVMRKILFAELSREISKAIDTLPHQSKRVIKLMMLDMTPLEIAHQLNVTRQNVLNIQSYSKRMLAEILLKQIPDQ